MDKLHVKKKGPNSLRESREAQRGGGAPEAGVGRAESTAHTGPSSLGPPPTQDQPEKGEPALARHVGSPCPFSSLQVTQVPGPSGLGRSWSPAPGRPLTTWLWPLLGWSSLGTDAPWAPVTSR